MKVYSSLKWILSAICLAIFCRIFIISVYKVPTISMAPTLLPGDFIISNQMSYGFKFPWMEQGYFASAPSKGDVVVFKVKVMPGTTFVKRIVAVPGDTIEIHAGKLSINNQECSYQQIDRADLDLSAFSVFEETCLDSAKRLVIRATSSSLSQKDVPTLKLQDGQYFVLGDNRDTSEDSRDWGPLAHDQITSKVSLIWLSVGSTQDSISKERGLRFSRFLTFVQ